MDKTKFLSILMAIIATFSTADQAKCDIFGSGPNTFDIEFVTIGDPGNSADTTGSPNPAGAVPYAYRIGKFEISEQMIDKANAIGGLGLSKDTRGADKPVTSVSWDEAARFVNWLNSSQGYHVAYKFPTEPGDAGYNTFQDILLWTPSDAGYDSSNQYRNQLARYFLPSADEWYKAAFYNPINNAYFDYPMGSDNPPDGIDFFGDSVFEALYNDGYTVGGPVDITNAGVPSPYGTVAQAGNVWEWEETDVDLVNDSATSNRGIRGGDWSSIDGALLANYRLNNAPGFEIFTVGFRVASTGVPETSTFLLLGIGAISLFSYRKAKT